METPPRAVADDEQQPTSQAIGAMIERQAVIEQAKGMLMVIYVIDAGGALELLERRSHAANVTVADLAQHVSNGLFSAASHHDLTTIRATCDHLLHVTQDDITKCPPATQC